jgi:aspartate carbamoyltransferase catalytic subunit
MIDTAQTMAAMGAHIMILRVKEEDLHYTLD